MDARWIEMAVAVRNYHGDDNHRGAILGITGLVVMAIWLLSIGVIPGCSESDPQTPDDDFERELVDNTEEWEGEESMGEALDSEVTEADPPEEEAPPPICFELPEPPTGAQVVAIFDDTDGEYPYPSVYGPGLDEIEAAVHGADFTAIRLHRGALNNPECDLSPLAAVIFGGGYAFPGYTLGIERPSKLRLRAYVEAGGVYVGICAGAYFASDSIEWEGAYYNDSRGYSLDLYAGQAVGPIDPIAIYPASGLASLSLEDHPALVGLDGASPREVYYLGGPYFPEPPEEAQILARYKIPDDPLDGQAGAIAQPFGPGMVILWGVHNERVDDTGMAPNHDLFQVVLRWAVTQTSTKDASRHR